MCTGLSRLFNDSLILLFISQAPSQAPEVINAYSSSSKSLVVKWNKLYKHDFNGVPIGCKVSYYPVGLEKNLSFESTDHTKNTTELTSLVVFTMYLTKVSAVSSGGVGPGITSTAQTGDEGRCREYCRVDLPV